MFSTAARKRAGLVLLYLCGAALILLIVGTLASMQQQAAETRVLAERVRATQLDGTPLGKQLASSSQRILDCTDPTGTCYHNSQKRTAEAVGNINRVVVLAAACSVGLSPQLSVAERQSQIQSCVIDRLAR